MFEIEAIPGPCALCYKVALELKRIPGRCGDGICEFCDRVRFEMLHNKRDSFIPWAEQKVRAAWAEEKRKERAAQAVPPARSFSTVRRPLTVGSAMRRAS